MHDIARVTPPPCFSATSSTDDAWHCFRRPLMCKVYSIQVATMTQRQGGVHENSARTCSRNAVIRSAQSSEWDRRRRFLLDYKYHSCSLDGTTGKRLLGKNNGFLLILVTMKQHKTSAHYFRCSIYVNRKYMYAS
jgi:hypothetical protein